MNELAILGLLMEQPLHGYELKKRLSGLLGGRASLSFGSLYPALGRLERTGLVTVLETDAAGTSVPMTGSLGGEVAAYRARMTLTTRSRRNRKVYAITAAGESRVLDLLRAPAPDDSDFLVQVAFCRLLATEERIELFRRRRDELARRVPARNDGRDRYLRSVRDRDSQAIANDIAWLDRLIDDELAIDNDRSSDEADTPSQATAPDPALPGGAR